MSFSLFFRTLVLGIVFQSFFGSAVHARPLEPNELLTRIAFGGCNHQWSSQNHWNQIASLKPQLWIWNGDIIYADPLKMSARQAQYRWLKHAAQYQRLLKTAMVVGTWDDHDFGTNDGGKAFKEKEASQAILLDFLDEPQNSPRRLQKGIYTSHDLGPQGQVVRIVLLDERYFRDDPGPKADILGEAQWTWLEKVLLSQGPRLTLLVSSTQLLPFDHSAEKWADYPEARRRMLKLLEFTPTPTLILSGDRHLGEISKLEFDHEKTVYELTSSGLTHHTPHATSRNRLRVGDLYTKKNFGWLDLFWSRSGLKVEGQIRSIDGRIVNSVSFLFK